MYFNLLQFFFFFLKEPLIALDSQLMGPQFLCLWQPSAGTARKNEPVDNCDDDSGDEDR